MDRELSGKKETEVEKEDPRSGRRPETADWLSPRLRYGYAEVTKSRGPLNQCDDV